MAYCNKCGAYIPDGQTRCLACGYDEQEERQNAAAAAASAAESAAGERYGFDSSELRRKLEEQRRKQQEQSYAWAQQERERRERAQQRAEREREESQARAQQAKNSASYGTGAASKATNRGESKLFAVLSYVSVLSLIPLLFRRDDEYALYHARQGLALLIYGVVADILGAIPGIGWIFGAFRVVCVFKGMINAANDIKEPLPYIGKFAERFR